jgi:murein DD-endopeptidase MepM/ murein hydrolase activator NlpD
MRSPRYTILFANRNTGAVRRLTVSRRKGLGVLAGLLMIPVLTGLVASSVDPIELESLRLANESLRIENDSYRTATSELAEQVFSLQSALAQLGSSADLDPAVKDALAKLPPDVASPAVGGGPAVAALDHGSPASTIGMLKGVLGGLEHRLAFVKSTIERQQERERATPSSWPLVVGWLSSGFGNRRDPIDGSADFHSGLDIAANAGTPVRATADGTVLAAAYQGNYGNAVLVEHGFGMATRFGHLSRFAVRSGQRVARGDIVGYVGSTGRVTGSHLNYEILIDGRPTNPLRFLGRR